MYSAALLPLAYRRAGMRGIKSHVCPGTVRMEDNKDASARESGQEVPSSNWSSDPGGADVSRARVHSRDNLPANP
jgi:hypothetical protein